MTIMFYTQIYNLSAKNPNKAKGVIYRKPEELLESVSKREKAIEQTLTEIHQVLNQKQ